MFRIVMAVTLLVSLSIAMVGCEPSMPRIDPSKEKGLVSLDTDVAVSITIKNKTKSPISLHWLDEGAGDRVHYKDIEAGAEVVQQTWKDHYWIILDKDGKALGIYKTTDKDGVIVIK